MINNHSCEIEDIEKEILLKFYEQKFLTEEEEDIILNILKISDKNESNPL